MFKFKLQFLFESELNHMTLKNTLMHDDFSDQTLKGPVRLLTLVTHVLKHYSLRSCSGQEVTNISLLYGTRLDIKSVRESRRRKEERYLFILFLFLL